MSCDRFFCKECNRYFDDPKYYYEQHGLDSLPYERVAVCPECEGDDFVEFDCKIEKIEVAEKILPIILQLNIYTASLEKIFGNKMSNSDLEDSIVLLADAVTEMFEFLDVDMQRRILNIDTDKELERILSYLDGES